MTWNAEDWQRLGDRFRWGRRKAGYSTKEGFAEAIGISSKTYGDIEAGRLAKRGSFSFDTIAQIEDALEWEPGVSRTILDGRSVDVYSGMLLPREDDDPWKDIGKVDDTDPTIAWLDERVERLEERVLKIERLVRGASDDAGRRPKLSEVSVDRLSVEPSAAEPERKDVEGDTEGETI